MNKPAKKTAAAAAVAAAALGAHLTYADEGMWTLDNLPAAQLKERYGFQASQAWLDHVRLASVRFNDGGSGAFVSADGLVLTNHHVALGQLQKVSTQKNDYVKHGFFARSGSEEMKCPDLELNQLVSMENVTDRVLKALDVRSSDRVQNEQRKAEISRIEKESTEKTGLRSDVVELYQGGEYWLYRYKKYTDIRLVMAPEAQAAFYGGDPDNFTYPRYDLDFAFFRVYEDGKPAKPKDFFKWSKAGAKDGELVFVSGHPGSTDRLKTVRQLEYERDYHLPDYLKILNRRRKAFYAYAAAGPEQARRAKDLIFGFENSIKAISGELDGLKDAQLMKRKADQEMALRQSLSKDPKLKQYADAWDKLARAQDKLQQRHEQLMFRGYMGSKLAGFATTIVRYVVEVEKPNDKRYKEYRDSALESLNFRLYSPAPVYKDLEQAVLADAFQQQLEVLGKDDAHVKAALGGADPKAKAAELVSGTKLDDPAYRKQLITGGRKAVEASKDPMIVWARSFDPAYRELRKWAEDEIESVEALEGNRIAKARFAKYGKSAYPDATFTLRLSFGRVAGYDQGTTKVPYKTTFYGLYDRAASFDNAHPFDLPEKVAKAKDTLDLATPLNFVTTNDIIGGNSGSPVFNKDAEYVGLIFDGNIQSLVGRYAYDDTFNRAVAVHSAGIVEAMRKIYGMDALADELTRR
jgi:uncharacterized protein (UPF0335 family)